MKLLGRRARSDLEFQVTIPPEMMQGMAPGSIAPRISRAEALQVPAVMRGRNLIAGTLARLPIHIRDKQHRIVRGNGFLEQIDPDIPNVVTIAQTYEDLLFEATSWWYVTARTSDGYPYYAEHIAPSRVFVSNELLPVTDQTTQITYGSPVVYLDGVPVRSSDMIRFDSPNPPVLVHGARAIRTCLALDQSAARYASENLPLGYFTPKDDARPNEDDQFVTDLLDKWETARARRAWAYLGGAWEAKVLQFNAEQIQLAEQRQHAVLEIARLMGVDPEDLGVSTTSRTYQNSEQRRQDLIDFTLAHYMSALEERLSMGDVTPRGYEVKVNLDAFLRADTLTRMNAYKIGEEVGAYTVAEVRELEDRPPLPGGASSLPGSSTATAQAPTMQPTSNGNGNGSLG